MFNERSVAVLDAQTARDALGALLKARTRHASFRAALYASRALPDVQLANGVALRSVVAMLDQPTRQQLFSWTATHGPFHEDLRADFDDDLFIFDGHEVTDGGLGEAARQQLGGLPVASFSLPTAFAYTPLIVIQGFAETPITQIGITNYWDAASAAEEIEAAEPEPTSWTALLAQARVRFANLIIGTHCDIVLARQPFEPAAARQIIVRLADLHRFVEETGSDGSGLARASASTTRCVLESGHGSATNHPTTSVTSEAR